jgi:cell division protein FtsB
VVLAVAVVLLALFLYSALQTATQSYRLNRQQEGLQREVYELRLQRAELVGLLTYLGSDEYIEGVARSRFGLVRPGETAVVVDAPEAAEPQRLPGQRWWEARFGR